MGATEKILKWPKRQN